MAIILKNDDFKVMPWKNGGGISIELYKIPHSSDSDRFYFRLSVANVEMDGPFSLFPGIDRSLVCLSGNGFRLNFNDHVKILSPLDMIDFKGEEKIFCELVQGPCQDFNMMVDSTWAKVIIEIRDLLPKKNENICSEFKSFNFLHLPSPVLIVLEPNEAYEVQVNEPIKLITVKLFQFLSCTI